MTDFKFLEYTSGDGLVTITLNRPPYNVLDIALMEELNHALTKQPRMSRPKC